MRKTKQFIASFILSAGLLAGQIAPIAFPVGLGAVVITQTACEDKDIHKFKVDLLKASQTLNTAAKTNHALYEQKIYGEGPAAIATRQKVATGIHAANDYLIAALDYAKTLTPETFNGGKGHVLELLSQALTALSTVQIGKPQIDVVIQSAVLLINNAVIIANAFKGGQ